MRVNVWVLVTIALLGWVSSNQAADRPTQQTPVYYHVRYGPSQLPGEPILHEGRHSGSEAPEEMLHGDEMPDCMECEGEHEEEEEEEPSDLTLHNLFSEGWFERFHERSREGRAPRFHYFTTRQPTLEREIRFNYAFVDDEEQEADVHEIGLVGEWALNRRFSIELEPTYTWAFLHSEGRRDRSEAGFRAITFFQLVDTYCSALNVQFAVTLPPDAVELEEGEEEDIFLEQNHQQTFLSVALAGFQDLTDAGLYRVGVTSHLEYVGLVGPTFEETAHHFVTYGLTTAKTFTEPDFKGLADFTLFLETFGETELDGVHDGRTHVSLLPGLRFNVGSEEKPWWVMAGVQVPLTGPRPYDEIFRVTLIRSFE
jgi:hypothetical protein